MMYLLSAFLFFLVPQISLAADCNSISYSDVVPDYQEINLWHAGKVSACAALLLSTQKKRFIVPGALLLAVYGILRAEVKNCQELFESKSVKNSKLLEELTVKPVYYKRHFFSWGHAEFSPLELVKATGRGCFYLLEYLT